MAFMPTRGGRGPSTPIIFVPTLNDLVLSGALVAGVASTGTILNATTGSVIASTVPGLTVNSPARTYSYNGAGSAGSVQGLTETLAGATFSPRNNTVTIVSASIPAFTSNPSISPTSGNTATTFTAIDGAMSNGGAVLGRRWVLNGTSIGTGTTIVPGAQGSLVLENTGTGNVLATSTAITVTATGTPTPTPMPTPTFSTVAVNQPASMGFSWHEMHPLISTDGNSVILNASDEEGNARSLKVNRLTGQATADKLFLPRQWVKDDHHAMSELKHSAGPRLLAMAGHAARYAAGAIINEIAIYRASDGLWDSYSTDRNAGSPNVIIITLPTSRIPNYLQLYEIPAGLPNAGRILLYYNDDNNAVWPFIMSDDLGLTWVENRPFMGRSSSGWGGNVPQLYSRIDWDDMYTGPSPVTGAFTSTFVPAYGYLHPNCPGGAQCRFTWIDLATGRGHSPDNGNAVNSGASIYTTGSIGTPMVSLPLASNPAAQNVRVPATGRTQRVNYVFKGLVYTTDMMQDMATDCRHVINKKVNGVRTDFDLGPCGVPFWDASGYCPDLQPGFDPHSGDLAYRVTNGGVTKNAGGKLERLHWPNGIENGNVQSQVLWEAGKNGVPANLIAARFFPVRGAQATGVVGFLMTFTSYVRYEDWTGGQFYAIIRS